MIAHAAAPFMVPLGSDSYRVQGIRKQALETGQTRLVVTGFVFALLFLALGGRAIDLTVLRQGYEPSLARAPAAPARVAERATITDRNGLLLASSVPTGSLYVNPQDFQRSREAPEEAAKRLARLLPELSEADVAQKLASDKQFIYLKRNLTPRQQNEINRLGIVGLNFQREEKRFYPNGPLASHILGLTDVDGRGVAGIERQFDDALRGDGKPVALSIDIRLQAILRDELTAAVKEFKALGAAGLVMDVNTGEVLSMVSLPDFDPNDPTTLIGEAGFNRVTKGAYEMGSTFKLFNTAIALDSGATNLNGRYDASHPIQIAQFKIHDYHAKNRVLTVPEIFMYSSNIGSAKMALDYGTSVQRRYMNALGMLSRSPLELPEVGDPLSPTPWRDINTMTISYGHGMAVTPIQMASAASAVVNGGHLRPATLIKRDSAVPVPGERVLSEKTSRDMRSLLRLVVRSGTGGKAEVAGYLVGGKTGTAEKQGGGRYRTKALLSSFLGVFPLDDPRYLILVMIDEPVGNEKTYGYATGGWVAAPSVGRIVERMAPLYGLAPVHREEAPKPGDPLFVAVNANR